jgi:hypothetical protein
MVERAVEHGQRSGIDQIFRIVQHDHAAGFAGAGLVLFERGIEVVQAVGLGRGARPVHHDDAHARIALRAEHGRRHRRRIVRIAADIEEYFVLRPSRQRMPQTARDDLVFLPGRDQHRSRARQGTVFEV